MGACAAARGPSFCVFAERVARHGTSSRKVSTSLRFCRMMAASRLTLASSFVLSRTSCERTVLGR
eukprot:2350996-Pleurochrysis_carterae.AAC.6